MARYLKRKGRRVGKVWRVWRPYETVSGKIEAIYTTPSGRVCTAVLELDRPLNRMILNVKPGWDVEQG